jgi:Zn-dependent M28 family amino/carboxypeptidase
MGHLEALQGIADAHDGHRSGATSGYFASLDYAESVFEEAGYTVQRLPFSYPGWEVTGPAVLEAVGQSYVDSQDISPMVFSPSGDVTAPLHRVDLVLPPTNNSSSTSGCETEDFDDFPPGAIALIQRGTCTFNIKALNAEAAGATGVILFNEGQADRQDLEPWQLDSETDLTIPVLGATFEVGDALAAAMDEGPVEARIVVDVLSGTLTSENLIVDSAGGDPDQVVIIGGHLDSVPSGAGINDNGSGTAFILELAVQLAEHNLQPKNTLRFALWGSEELGLLGSTAYVESLPGASLDRIVAKLNFDMLGSPNGIPMIYDGDGDGFGIPGPSGSDDIEEVFTAWFDDEGLAVEPTAFDGRSDYAAFIAEGIPAGGLFSGADATKTSSEASLYGGTAGFPHDPCYHQSCDDINNIDADLFLTLSRAAAHTSWALADRKNWRRRSAENAVLPLAISPEEGTSCSAGSAHRGPLPGEPSDR